MTLFSWGNPRYFPRLPPPVRRYFDVDHDARVVADCHWQPEPWTRPTIIVLHGLNGSSDAHYMRGIAAKAFARGMNVVRLNQRNCGDTEHLSAGLFHSGLTADAAHVIDGAGRGRRPPRHRGGRLFARRQPRAEAGRRVRRRVRRARVRGVAAVSPIIEIGECVKALEQPGNGLYQWNFVQGPEAADAAQGPLLAGPLRSEQAARRSGPCASSTRPTRRPTSASPARTTTTTARARCASSSASASRRSSSRPTTTRSSRRSRSAIRRSPGNPCIRLAICEHGGHCGFVGPASADDDGYWAENQIVDFVGSLGHAS